MDEPFLININCANILFDSQESHYTMFIDGAKISIVYELVEWIRWIFAVENCIYLTHENSVIHELEDIRVLSKLKNLEIKLCGRPNCVHTKTYRSLLSNLNLFVSWNNLKVPKYFLEKVNQMNEKTPQEKIRTNDHLKFTSNKATQSFMLDENIKNSNDAISSEKNNLLSCDQQLSESNMEGFSYNKKRASVENSEFESSAIGKSSAEKNHLNKRSNSEDSFLNHFEKSSDHYNDSANSRNTNGILNIKNCANLSPLESPMKDEFKIKNKTSKSSKKSSSCKSARKIIRPFSLGEILSNIREDFEKRNMEDTVKATSNTPEKENFDEMMSAESLFVTESQMIKGKKRQRVRKRKKSKKQNLGNEYFMSPPLKDNNLSQSFKIFNTGTNIKPNHIRFDADDEGNPMETSLVQNKLMVENENGNDFEVDEEIKDLDKISLKTGTPKSSFSNDNYQYFSNLSEFSPVECHSESKMKNLEINDEVEDEVKVTDLNNQICDNYQRYNTNFNEDTNIVQSLKEKFKNAVVIKRFY